MLETLRDKHYPFAPKHKQWAQSLAIKALSDKTVMTSLSSALKSFHQITYPKYHVFGG
jgi:hypothetical protein